MRVLITNADHTDHDGKTLPYMQVDGHGFLLDLAGIGQLWDPTVASISWGPVLVNGEQGECGYVRLKNGTGRNFADASLLTPYLKAWKVKKAELEAAARAPAA